MNFIYNDGGKAAAGFKGQTRDCGVRAVAIASNRPYLDVYKEIGEACKNEKASKRRRGTSSPRNGVHGHTMRSYLESQGWKWTPTMRIGQGCKVHLREDELPGGRLVVVVSKHYTAVIDGVIHDTHDPQRLPFGEDFDKGDIHGTRCVYGYYSKAA